MKILQCHSKGDRRFSAMYAQVKINGEIKSIEKWYQESKRDKYGNIPGKGKHVDYMIWNNKTYSPNNLTKLYYKLWKLYFEQNPELLNYACQFDDFVDIFKGKSINNQADTIRDILRKGKGMRIKGMRFTKMVVYNNRELKEVHNNVVLNIRTRNTEDLLDINRQIWRLKKEGFGVILQSPRGKLLPARALGKYTREHVNIEIGGLSEAQIEAKLANLKYMMSHKEYVDIPMYETSYPSAFDYKTPKTDEDDNVVTQTVEKIVYLNRQYTITVNGEYCHSKAVKKLAKSFKIPLASVAGNQFIDPNDQSYLLEDCTENTAKLIKEKYETISPEKKEMLLKFFGTHNPDISDFEDFSYAMINFKMFRFDDLPLPNKVDAEEFNNMLGAFKVPNAYDIMYDLAEKGMLVNLDNYPELKHFEEARFFEDSYVDEDPLD